MTVFTGCSLVTRPMMFVVPNLQVNGDVDSTTTITLKCTPNTDFTVDIDKGLYANGINRRMYSAEANSYVTYDVYRDVPRTNVWGTHRLDRRPDGRCAASLYMQLGPGLRSLPR